tara:strand:+ start:646 stop:1797 length:1152 start_codon:yes stop_codon:yes gene_type:complete
MLFKEIVGLEKTKKQLITSLNKKRVAHSQLFSGPKGSGKLATVVAYAQFLNCTLTTNEDSCGNCSSCLKFSKLSHPDFHIIFPTVKKTSTDMPFSEDFLAEWKEQFLQNPYFSLKDWMLNYKEIFLEKQSDKKKEPVIYSHQIKELNRKLSLKIYEAKKRVVLIWMPEKMNIQAANKFLKLLEEPPKNTMLFLVSEEKEKLLKTVISRLQETKIPQYSVQETIDASTADKAESFINFCKLSNGDLGKVLYYQPGNTKAKHTEQFVELMRLSFKSDFVKIAEWVDLSSTVSRQEQIEFLTYSIGLYRECLIYNYSDKKLNTLSDFEQEFLKKFAKFIHQQNSILIIELFEDAIKNINRNANSKIIFFHLAMELITLLKVKVNFA